MAGNFVAILTVCMFGTSAPMFKGGCNDYPRGPFPSFSFCLIDLERRTPEAVRAGGYVTTGQCVRTWADAR